MHELAEAMEKSECVKEVKEKLLECFKSQIAAKGLECVDTEEAGEVVDMIKDLAETERNCMEALYYQKVIEAMVNYDEPRYGYIPNQKMMGRWDYSSDSSVPTRYMPHTRQMKYDGDMDSDDYMREAMGRGRSTDRSGSEMYNGDKDPRYGQAYNEYKTTRKHYTMTGSPDDRHEMDMHADEHVHDTIATIRDIWKDADPALKKRMKEDFTKLLNEMTI